MNSNKELEEEFSYKPRFEILLDDKDVAGAIDLPCKGLEGDVVVLAETPEKIQSYETVFANNTQVEYDSAFYTYSSLREIFSNEAVRMLVQAYKTETLPQCIELLLKQERESVLQILENAEEQQKFQASLAALKNFYADVEVSFPRESAPRAQFLGLIEGKMFELYDGGGFLGRYNPVLDGVYVRLSREELDSKIISEKTHQTYLHENKHGLSFALFDKGENIQAHPLSFEEYASIKSGFISVSRRKNNRSRLNRLNEGETELVARLCARRSELSFSDEPDLAYDEEVNDMAMLCRFLHGQDITKLSGDEFVDFPLEELKPFIHADGSKEGVLMIGRILDEKVGHHALKLFDLFGNRLEGGATKFLQSIQKYRQDGIEQPIVFNEAWLEEYHISRESLRETYPFCYPTKYLLENNTFESFIDILGDEDVVSQFKRLLEEFYRDRKIDPATKLIVRVSSEGKRCIMSTGENKDPRTGREYSNLREDSTEEFRNFKERKRKYIEELEQFQLFFLRKFEVA